MSSQDNLHRLVVDVETGITTKIELTDAEISIYLAEQKKIADEEIASIAEEKATAEAKQLLLNKLGITENEAKLLLQ